MPRVCCLVIVIQALEVTDYTYYEPSAVYSGLAAVRDLESIRILT